MPPVPVVLSGLGAGLGVAGLAAVLLTRQGGKRRDPQHPLDATTFDAPAAPTTTRYLVGGNAVHALLAIGLGVVGVLVTGWPAALPIVGLAGYGLPRVLGRMSVASSIAKTEAVATWTEMLQGTLAASAGLSQAIIATAGLSPAPIRPAAERLATQLQADVHPRAALIQFAEDVGDPCADRVVCALLLAFSARAQRLADLLGTLADSTREEVALQLRVETSRASVRSGVRTVIVFSVAFAVSLAILARPYLSPFDSSSGQVILLAVGALYASGISLMVALARPPAPVRLLGQAVGAR
jgi:hypothetical protein